MKKLFLISIIICVSFSCKENPAAPQGGSIAPASLFIFDTVQVTVGYDDTPGFISPAEFHEIYVVARLTKRGSISWYDYRSENTRYSISVDGLFLQPNTPFQRRIKYWVRPTVPPGSYFNYSLNIGADTDEDVNVNMTLYGNGTVQHATDGPSVEHGAQELNDDPFMTSHPIFSVDGNWLYYSTFNGGTSECILYKLPVSGGTPQKIFSTNAYFSFTVSKIDNAVLMIPWRYPDKSKIYKLNPASGQCDSVETNGYLWDGSIYDVEDQHKILCCTDPNNSPTNSSDLVFVDIYSGKIDTVLHSSRSFWDYRNYSIRPHTNTLSYTTTPDSKTMTVHLYDWVKKSESVFASNIEGDSFFWAPNGSDYAVIRRVGYDKISGSSIRNIFFSRSGTEQRITTYPGEDYDIGFSPTENIMAFQSERRGNIHIWKIAY